MSRNVKYLILVVLLGLTLPLQAARDITKPGDAVQGVPNDGISQNDDHGWPGNEPPHQAIDDRTNTKFLHFKGDIEPTGIRITPAAGPTVVTGLSFTTANDNAPRDPVRYELSGSNESINGPYTLIAEGDIVDFAGGAEWPRFTKNTTPIKFANTVAYEHYQVMFPVIRDAPNASSMQIAEIELLADILVPTAPSPADGTVGVVLPLLQWMPGDTALLEDVYVGTTPELTEADRVATQQSAIIKMFYYVVPLVPGQTYYWRVDDIDVAGTVYTGTVWSFTAAPLAAYDPSPKDGAKWVDVDADLSWVPGKGAIKHDLYFGTDEAAVAARDAGVFKGTLIPLLFDPGTLEQETTYYWVVDEPGQPGEVWSFTTIGGGGGIKGEYFSNTTLSGMPALTRIDPEVNFNLIGVESPGDPIPGDGWSARWTADLDIAVADTFTFAVNCQDGTRLWIDGKLLIDQWITPTVTSTYYSLPIYLERGIHSLRLEYFDNDGDAVEELSWSTPTMEEQIIPAGPLQPPLRAQATYPMDGAVDVPQDLSLIWAAGDKAVTHDVYFGEDADAVAAADTSSPEYQGRQAETTFALSDLEWGKTYSWRIDGVNDLEADSPWVGGVWSFTTADFLVVDDIESYTDDMDAGEAIWQTWIDGLTNGTGSIVGYFDAPFAEQTIVHGGVQSLPLDYNNIIPPYYSEAELPLDPTQDWTVNGVSELTLYVRGNTAGFVETAPGQYQMSANSSDIWGASDNGRFVYKQLNGDGAISAKVLNVDNTNNFAKGGVMIRETLDPASSYAFMFPTPSGRRAFQNRPGAAANAISAHSAEGEVSYPLWVKVERTGNVFTAYYSTDGNNWIVQPDTENTGTDMSPNPQTIFMTGSVSIGLALSSNNGQGGVCFAEFSDVDMSGSVSGQWKVADLGDVAPANDPVDLYVAVEDSSNTIGVVVNPDPAAVNATDWIEWKIPLTEFGVNATRVKTLFIGLGDRDNPTPGGAGTLYIDDIRVTKPEPAEE